MMKKLKPWVLLLIFTGVSACEGYQEARVSDLMKQEDWRQQVYTNIIQDTVHMQEFLERVKQDSKAEQKLMTLASSQSTAKVDSSMIQMMLQLHMDEMMMMASQDTMIGRNLIQSMMEYSSMREMMQKMKQ